MKGRIKLFSNLVRLGVFIVFISCCNLAWAQDGTDPSVVRWAFLSAAIVTGLSSLAAGIAVAYVGSASVGAMSEKPELAGKVLIYVGLAEGIAIYGLIIAIMILGKI
jgi:V/A-type H+-transporting ATPase subunit K